MSNSVGLINQCELLKKKTKKNNKPSFQQPSEVRCGSTEGFRHGAEEKLCALQRRTHPRKYAGPRRTPPAFGFSVQAEAFSSPGCVVSDVVAFVLQRWCWRHPWGSDLLRMASFQNNIYHEKDDIRWACTCACVGSPFGFFCMCQAKMSVLFVVDFAGQKHQSLSDISGVASTSAAKKNLTNSTSAPFIQPVNTVTAEPQRLFVILKPMKCLWNDGVFLGGAFRRPSRGENPQTCGADRGLSAV